MHETSAQGWCTGKTQRDGWGGRPEGGSGWGTHVNPCLIHVNVWQKPLQYCKVISLQLIKKKKKIWYIYTMEYYSAINNLKITPFAATWMDLGPSRVALVVKSPPANAGDIRDMGLIPGSGRCPGGGHGNPLQYSCLENPMNRGAWWATYSP